MARSSACSRATDPSPPRASGRIAPSGGPWPFALALVLVGAAGVEPGPPPAGSTPVSPEAVRALIDQGRYTEAEAQARRLLAAAESTYGPSSLAAAGALDVLVQSLLQAGKSAAPGTRELAQRAVAIRERAAEADQAALGASLCALGEVVRAHNDYAEARSVFERSLHVREEALGPDHSDVAHTLIHLGDLSVDVGEYDQAKLLLERSLTILEKALGPEHLDVAESLNGLGRLASRTGDYAGSQTFYERSLAIRERALGPDHPLVSKSLFNVGATCQTLGDYARAKALHERALRIQKETVGPDHPLVGSSYLAMGTIEHVMGDYAAARAYYLAARDILKRHVEMRNTHLTIVESNLALLLQDSGDIAEARRIEEHVLALQREALGESHRDVGTSYCRLGALHLSAGDTAAASRCYEQARGIFTAALAPEDPSWIECLLGRAELLAAAGEVAAAARLGDHSLALARRSFAPTQHTFLDLLPFQAGLLRRQGDVDGACRLYAEALAIADQIPGANSPQVIAVEQGFTLALAVDGKRTQALAMAEKAARNARIQVELTARTLPERQALAYAAQMRQSTDLLLSVLDATKTPSRDEKERTWDLLITSRALVFDEMAGRNATWREAGDADIQRLTAAFRAARCRYATLLVRGPGSLPEDHYLRLVAEARRESEEAEEQLAARSLDFRRRRERGIGGLAGVLARLPAETALVAFTRFERSDVAPTQTAARSAPAAGPSRPVAMYGAFIAIPGEEEPAWVRIGPATVIDSLIAAWRSQLTGVDAPWISPGAAEAACRQAGAALRASMWDQVSPLVAQARQIFVVPDGELCRVALAALPTDPERYLIESGPLIHFLAAERDLIPGGEAPERGAGLLALGGADFDRSGADLTDAVLGLPPQRELASRRRSDCLGLESIVFEPLPATEREIDDVISIWSRHRRGEEPGGGEPLPPGVVRLAGADATEEALKRSASGKAVLHLATHGIFLDGSCVSARRGRRGIGGVEMLAAPSAPSAVNPLHLSALALAGANRRAAATPAIEDGILTAEEVATLDLAGAEWVVLSACDTGLGSIQSGEGILGLRRAFRIAGARTLIMSLWPVEDESTREWMRALYAGRFAQGLGTAEAVRYAARTILETRRKGGESAHPFFWAGFVASGDWR